MSKNLVIVESPAKAKTIEKFLGKDYKVMSSYGHIRDIKKKNFLYEQQLELCRRQSEERENAYAHLRQLRHDMKHHLLALKAYAQAGKCDAICRYLDDCISYMDVRDTGVWSGNPVVDALLGYYKGNAEDEGIRTELHVETDKPLPVSDTDICIILGNLLENAYEACMRQKRGERFIKIRLHHTGDVLIVMVENSYEGTVRKEDGRFLSSKAEMRKGIGITSVLDVCKKYNGIPKIEYNGSVFKVSILLNGISK